MLNRWLNERFWRAILSMTTIFIPQIIRWMFWLLHCINRKTLIVCACVTGCNHNILIYWNINKLWYGCYDWYECTPINPSMRHRQDYCHAGDLTTFFCSTIACLFEILNCRFHSSHLQFNLLLFVIHSLGFYFMQVHQFSKFLEFYASFSFSCLMPCWYCMKGVIFAWSSENYRATSMLLTIMCTMCNKLGILWGIDFERYKTHRL